MRLPLATKMIVCRITVQKQSLNLLTCLLGIVIWYSKKNLLVKSSWSSGSWHIAWLDEGHENHPQHSNLSHLMFYKTKIIESQKYPWDSETVIWPHTVCTVLIPALIIHLKIPLDSGWLHCKLQCMQCKKVYKECTSERVFKNGSFY